MTIGQRIRQKRQEMGLTVDDLASKLGKNRATVYRYESDAIKNLPISILVPLAEVLNTTPGDLMGQDRDDEISEASSRATALDGILGYYPYHYVQAIELYEMLSEENQEKTLKYMQRLKELQDMDFDVLLAAHSKDSSTEEQLKQDALKIMEKAKK